MSDTNDILDDILEENARSSLARWLAHTPLGGWFIYACGLFMLLGAGISTAPREQEDFLKFFLLGSFLVGFSLLLMLKISVRAKGIAALAAALLFLGSALTGTFYIPIEDYDRAVAYMENGDYARAQELFEELKGFRDSPERAAECGDWVQYMRENRPAGAFWAPDYDKDYARALEYMEQGRYELARVWFDWLGKCRDSQEKAQECVNYIEYERIMSANDQSPESIYKAMRQLRGFPPADELLATPEYQAIRERMLNTGGTVMLGQWSDQSGIVWQVIARDGDRALLLCSNPQILRNANAMADVTWADSDLRQWLNQDFLQKRFTAEQQALILPTALDNGGSGSPDTQDHVFPLSAAEVQQYLPTAEDRDVFQSVDGQYYSEWLLRTTGTPTDRVPFINRNGEIGAMLTRQTKLLVRPAMWVTLTPDIF